MKKNNTISRVFVCQLASLAVSLTCHYPAHFRHHTPITKKSPNLCEIQKIKKKIKACDISTENAKVVNVLTISSNNLKKSQIFFRDMKMKTRFILTQLNKKWDYGRKSQSRFGVEGVIIIHNNETAGAIFTLYIQPGR